MPHVVALDCTRLRHHNQLHCRSRLRPTCALQMHKQCWGGLSVVAFQKWGQYLWLALPCETHTQ